MTSATVGRTTVPGPDTRRAPGHAKVLAILAFTVAMIAALAIAQPLLEHPDILPPALVLALFSLYSFFQCGQRTVDASSVASYGVFMFIGFPASFGALGLYDSGQSYTARSLTIVVVLAFLFQAGLVIVGGREPRLAGRAEFLEKLAENPQPVERVFRLSLVMFLLSLITHFLGAGTAAAGFGWVAMLGGTVAAFWSAGKGAKIRGLVVVVATFLVETGLSLGGFGRLNLAVLALSLVVVASLRVNSWTVKILTALLTGPILVYLINQRLAYLTSERGASLVDESEGVGSIVGPFHSAGTIVEAILRGRIDPAWGETVFNAAVTGVPRALWPGKPVGFGREIVEITQPWMMYSAEHSDAGTFIGEAVWNFGVWLAPLYLVGFMVIIRFLDRRVRGFFNRTPDLRAFLVLMTVAMLGGTLLNIIWGSTSTVAARTLLPLAVLVAVRFIYAANSSAGKNPSGRKTAVRMEGIEMRRPR